MPAARDSGAKRLPLSGKNALAYRLDCFFRTNQHAQMTANAFPYVKDGLAVPADTDRLMSSVCAGDHTPPTADTTIPLKPGIDHGIALQNIRCFTDGVQREAAYFFNAGKPFFRQIEI